MNDEPENAGPIHHSSFIIHHFALRARGIRGEVRPCASTCSQIVTEKMRRCKKRTVREGNSGSGLNPVRLPEIVPQDRGPGVPSPGERIVRQSCNYLLNHGEEKASAPCRKNLESSKSFGALGRLAKLHKDAHLGVTQLGAGGG